VKVMDLPKPNKTIPAVWKCPICKRPMVEKTIKWIDGESFTVPVLDCKCIQDWEEREKLLARYRMANFPDKFHGENLSDWVEIPGTEEMHRITKAYLVQLNQNILQGRGMLLAGAVGTGKTKHVVNIQNHAIQLGYSTYYISSNELNTTIPKLKKARQGLDDFMHKLINVPLLVYDDFGETVPDKWDEKDSRLIINERYNHKKATLITTMKNIHELNDEFGGHVTSRMIEMAGPNIAEVKSEYDMRRPANRRKFQLADGF